VPKSLLQLYNQHSWLDSNLLTLKGVLTHNLVAMLQLGASFPVKLEAPHVVDVRKQVWAGAIGRGADGATLQATYKQADTTAFQDSMGKSVVEVCRVVPDGVLMFLPSYSMLDRLVTRWKVGCPICRLSAWCSAHDLA